jgi:hypothetical protein
VVFLDKLRTLYPFQPIFAFDTWGFPNDDGTFRYIYTGLLEDAVNQRYEDFLNRRDVLKIYFFPQESGGRPQYLLHQPQGMGHSC